MSTLTSVVNGYGDSSFFPSVKWEYQFFVIDLGSLIGTCTKALCRQADRRTCIQTDKQTYSLFTQKLDPCIHSYDNENTLEHICRIVTMNKQLTIIVKNIHVNDNFEDLSSIIFSFSNMYIYES